MTVLVWGKKPTAKAKAIAESKSNSKNEMRGFFAALRMTSFSGEAQIDKL